MEDEVKKLMEQYDKPRPSLELYESGGPTTEQLVKEMCEEFVKKGLIRKTEDGEYEPLE